VAEDDEVEQRGEDRRGDRLHAHLPEAQQLLVEKGAEAGHWVFVMRRKTSSRSGGSSSISTMPMPASRSFASASSTSRKSFSLRTKAAPSCDTTSPGNPAGSCGRSRRSFICEPEKLFSRLAVESSAAMRPALSMAMRPQYASASSR